MTHLRLVKTKPDLTQIAGANSTATVVGLPYSLKNKSVNQLGLGSVINGNYSMTKRKAELTPSKPDRNGFIKGYIWQQNLTCEELFALHAKGMDGQPVTESNKLLANRALLRSSKLIGPSIIDINDRPALTVSPEFIVSFNSDAGAAELGEIRLIDSSRFITLTSGKTIPIICTDPAEGQALMLAHGQAAPVKTQDFVQPANSAETYVMRRSINQFLPNLFNGESVAHVTVLEHVTSYIMQKISGCTDAIWTPVINPISWGWSVRAELNNADWAITRRKVIRPTLGDEGLELPTWSSHIEEQSESEWQEFLNRPLLSDSLISNRIVNSLDLVP